MKNLYNNIVNKLDKISVVGLGYVGMPIAVALSKKADVIGFDINKEKIDKYIQGIDVTNEVGNETLKNADLTFTSDDSKLKECKFHIVAVPTPINGDKMPDLNPVIGASKLIGRNLSKGSIVVFESTVYPGVTEEICAPILERESGLECGKDFKIGYSPERINPGDKVHRLENIVKVVSGMDNESLDIISKVYELIIEAGVYRAESIKVAEASKVIENSQRDINIAFMNELSMIFNKMGIDTKAVIEAASTKWNFMKFMPGLVGGHCIGVDPYYLTYRAQQLDYKSQIIAAGRRVNDNMGSYIADNIVKQLIKAEKKVKGAKIGILGLTFKEDCPDVRNTKIIDIVDALREYDMEFIITDPLADRDEVKAEYDIVLQDESKLNKLDCVVLAVAHKKYKEMNLNCILNLFNDGDPVIIDIKGILDKDSINNSNIKYWRL